MYRHHHRHHSSGCAWRKLTGFFLVPLNLLVSSHLIFSSLPFPALSSTYQLPVDWVADRQPGGHGEPNDNDDDDDVDMDDVLHFLANRRGGKHGIGQSTAGTSATAQAFLRSSYSAAPVVAKSIVMRPETAPSKLALAKEVTAIAL